MIPTISPEMPLSEMVQQSSAGVMFFHNHNHWGSYQILERALPAFKAARVMHFYIELSEKECKDALKAHFKSEGKSDALDKLLSYCVDKNQRAHLKALITSAHKIGIEVLAVDVNKVLNPGTLLAGDTKTAKELMQQRLLHEREIVHLVQSHVRQLAAGDKYIGLFGGNHFSVGKMLQAFLVYFQANTLDAGISHYNVLPEQIMAADPKSGEILKQFHIITFVPQSLEDSVDLSQPAATSKNLDYFNRLLSTLSLPQCQAYQHQNSTKISAAFFIQKGEMDTIWPKVVKYMDPFAKRCDTTYDPDRVVIIFDDIDEDSVRAKTVASLVKLRQTSITADSERARSPK